ncbi:MAG TPA: TauD/TfdA family dioxygenase [Pseudonocardiaceae bacterium]
MVVFQGVVDTGVSARLLADIATALAEQGATGENLLREYLTEVPADLELALRPHLALPDRTSGTAVISGLLEAFDDPGPTPGHWSDQQTDRARALDVALVLIASVIGKVFGWAGQQDGRLVHNILPSNGYEQMQVGASSTTPLVWHTEDSFHPARADLLMLACVRNNNGIGSKVASIRETRLTDDQIAQLHRPIATIMPDDSYPTDWRTPEDGGGIPTLWDAEDGLCMRYDPYYSKLPADDAEPAFLDAYTALGAALDACGRTLPISAGDILIIDNDVTVHGRSSFTPRYDGTDRWLKRLLIRLPRQRPDWERFEHGFGQATVESR